MKSWLHISIILILQIAAAPASLSQTGDKPCFCMEHISSAELKYYGCTEFKPENAATPEVLCRKEDSVIREAVDPKLYKRVPEGGGQCNPCNPPVRKPPKDCPRGESCPAPVGGKP